MVIMMFLVSICLQDLLWNSDIIQILPFLSLHVQQGAG